MAQKDGMPPFSAIFALRDSRVHVGSMNGCDIAAHVKAPINKYFSIASALYISYINPNYSHI